MTNSALDKRSDDYMPWRDQTVLDIVGDNIYHDNLEEQKMTTCTCTNATANPDCPMHKGALDNPGEQGGLEKPKLGEQPENAKSLSEMPSKPAEVLQKINDDSRWRVGSMYVGSSKLQDNTLDALLLDLDELQNKPRRLFDTLALIAAYHMKDGAQKDYVMDGINQWRAAVSNGAYGSVIELAELKADSPVSDLEKEKPHD